MLSQREENDTRPLEPTAMKDSMLATIWADANDVLAKTSTSSVLLLLLYAGLAALMIDYAYMVYLHFRMV